MEAQGEEHFGFEPLSHMVSFSLMSRFSRQESGHTEVVLSLDCALPLDIETGALLSLNLRFIDLARLAGQ